MAAVKKAAQLDKSCRSLFPKGLDSRSVKAGHDSEVANASVWRSRGRYTDSPTCSCLMRATGALDPQTEHDLIEAMSALRGVKTSDRYRPSDQHG